MSSPSVRYKRFISQFGNIGVNPFYQPNKRPQASPRQTKQDKIESLILQLVSLSDCNDKDYLAGQIKKLMDNPYQTRQTDRRLNAAEFRIDINQAEVESEVKRMDDLIKKVKELRSK